jgi:hypothetical protein
LLCVLALQREEYVGVAELHSYTVPTPDARSVTTKLAWVNGATVVEVCTWPADAGAPDADDPTLACGPKDPAAPAVVTVVRASAAATVKNVANSNPP